MDGYSKFFSSIGKIIAIGSILITLLLSIIDGLIMEIENRHIMIIMIFGIVSQILLITTTLYARTIVNRQMDKRNYFYGFCKEREN